LFVSRDHSSKLPCLWENHVLCTHFGDRQTDGQHHRIRDWVIVYCWSKLQISESRGLSATAELLVNGYRRTRLRHGWMIRDALEAVSSRVVRAPLCCEWLMDALCHVDENVRWCIMLASTCNTSLMKMFQRNSRVVRCLKSQTVYRPRSGLPQTKAVE